MRNENSIEIILLLKDGADKDAVIKTLERKLEKIEVTGSAESYISMAVTPNDYVTFFHGEIMGGTRAGSAKKPEIPQSLFSYVMKIYPSCGQSSPERRYAGSYSR